MVPLRIASSANLFGRLVLMPTNVFFLKSLVSISSHEYFSFRFGLVAGDNQTVEPGSFKPSIAPGFAQWAVTSSPFSRVTSAKNRL